MNKDYLRVFRAFSDEKRLRVLEMLAEGEQCACTLLEGLEISQPTLSYHMKILCQSGIVKERPVGPWKYYSIDAEGCDYARKLLQALSFGGENVEIRLIRTLARLGSAARRSGFDRMQNCLISAHNCACFASKSKGVVAL